MGFVGRQREIEDLSAQLQVVRTGRRADPGVAVMLRGRRRVGKSRLVDEFTRRCGTPVVYFQAARRAPLADELTTLANAVATSNLPLASVATDQTPHTLTAALTLLAAALPDDEPSVVVIDELPWLLEQVEGGAGELQRAWDTRLSKKPVLLLLLGSDLAMMEHLTSPEQPFYGRATEMVVDPLTPADVATMCGAEPFDAFDAYLVTGGLPLVAQEWKPGWSVRDFLQHSYSSSTSALVVSGGRALDSEFPEASLARRVLTSVGGRGERTFSAIQSDGGDVLYPGSLTSTLRMLRDKRVVAADEPLSARAAAKNVRYRIADPALRFWLAFVEPALAEVDRGRPDLALARVDRGFASWRGRAVEPVVRDALSRLLPDDTWPHVDRVGGWWPRTNVPEIDVVGTTWDRTVQLVGTIKWRQSPLKPDDVAALSADATSVPGVGAGTPLVGICPGGSDTEGFATVWNAADLLDAWR